MRTGRFSILSLFSLCLALGAESLAMGGYYKSFFVGFFPPGLHLTDTQRSRPAQGMISNRLRFNLDYRPCKGVSLQGAYDFTPSILGFDASEASLYYPQANAGTYRIRDFSARLYPRPSVPAGSFVVMHNLDRLNLRFQSKPAELTVGRQAIAWGSAKVINPTDIISPFSFHELDTEDRRGVDAVRLRIPLGKMDGIDMGWVAGTKGLSSRSAFFFRTSLNFAKTDWAFLLLQFQRHGLIGIDIARSIGGVGVWLEAALVKNRGEHDGSGTMVEKGYFRLSAGVENNFSSRFYGFLEYHFNSAGSIHPRDYERIFTRPSFQDGAIYLLGRHYLNLGITRQVAALLSLNGLLIANLNEGSLLFSTTLEYNLAQNVYLAAGAYIGIGKGPESSPESSVSSAWIFRSEFGSYPDTLFTSFRFYF